MNLDGGLRLHANLALCKTPGNISIISIETIGKKIDEVQQKSTKVNKVKESQRNNNLGGIETTNL